MNVADDDSGLTEQDRQAIAEIKRELDSEVSHDLPPDPPPPPPPEPRPAATPQARLAPGAPADPVTPRPRVAPRPPRRQPRRWSTTALVLAFVAGAVASAAGVLFTLLTARPAHRVTTPERPAVEAPTSSRSASPGTSVDRDGRVDQAPAGVATDSPRATSERAADSPAAALSGEPTEPPDPDGRTRREVRA